MIVKTSELRAIADRILAYFEETGRTEFEIPEDYYWSIPTDQLYDIENNPEGLTIGQLSDDWNEIKSILKNESPPIGYAAVWLSAILRAIGERSSY